MKRILAVSVLVGLLSACTPKILYIDRVVPMYPSDSLIQDCTTTPPPFDDSYLALSFDNKEKLSTGYSKTLINDIAVCNIDKLGIRTWKSESIKAIELLNKQTRQATER